MNFLERLSTHAVRLIESNNDELLVFLAVFLFVFLGKPESREASPGSEGLDGGTLAFLIAFLAVLLLGSSREENP